MDHSRFVLRLFRAAAGDLTEMITPDRSLSLYFASAVLWRSFCEAWVNVGVMAQRVRGSLLYSLFIVVSTVCLFVLFVFSFVFSFVFLSALV